MQYFAIGPLHFVEIIAMRNFSHRVNRNLRQFLVMSVEHACSSLFSSGEFSGLSNITNSGII